MGQALYRKYRSKKLSEIVGQEHVTTALKNALKNNKISHAYLLTGPKGVGKTSIARILAHELNGFKYDEDTNHLDIIEIDAASNRRIDEIRELRDKVHMAPNAGKYKVYIIDEVHMLTREAFNALLKTLEEPPQHAIFILATTEAHKLPETIVSRTQRYNFRPIEDDLAFEHLKSIAKAESITIEDDALRLIVSHGDGSFRDSIGLLDQIRNSHSKINLSSVQSVLGIAPEEVISNLIDLVQAGKAGELINSLRQAMQLGHNPSQIAKQTGEQLREQLINEQSKLSKQLSTKLLKDLLEVPTSHDPDKLLEIILLEACLEVDEPRISPSSETKESSVQKPEITDDILTEQPDDVDTKPELESQKITKLDGAFDESTWQEILSLIKAKHNTLYSVARMAVPSFSDNTLTLAFSFPFHKKRLSDSKNKQIISDIIKQTTGQTITINCIVETDLVPPIAKPAAQNKSNIGAIETISNIFGPTEVLE